MVKEHGKIIEQEKERETDTLGYDSSEMNLPFRVFDGSSSCFLLDQPGLKPIMERPKLVSVFEKEKPVVMELKNTEFPKPKQQGFVWKLNYDQVRNTFSDLQTPFTDVPGNDVTHLQQKKLSLKIGRRSVGAITCLILCGEGILRTQIANAFELKFVVPDRTSEEALSEVRDHAQDLLQVRDLLESKSWKAAQKTLRQRSALLKKDIYIIIQSKPGIERPVLRKLYSTLFNNVTRLDYAARDKDEPQVWQCYENIVVAVNDILSRI